MRLSTTIRYGARAIAQVALGYPDRPVSVREIAEQQALSAKYLERILKIMKASGLVQAVRGNRGGYVLGQAPDTITLKDVYDSLEGSAAPVDCVDCPDLCAMQDVCPTRETWVELKKAVEAVLTRTTVQNLVDARLSKSRAASSSPKRNRKRSRLQKGNSRKPEQP